MVKLKAQGQGTPIIVEVDAETGTNITDMKADILLEMDWVKLELTSVHIR